MSMHPLGSGPAASPPSHPVASPASSGARSSPPQASDSDSDDEEERDRRRAADPYARTANQISSAAAAPAPRARSEHPARAAAFWSALSNADGSIDEGIIRRYVFDYGCPEQPAGMRALLWKLLLGYLPWDRRQWASSLKRNRATYDSFVSDLTANPFQDMEHPLAAGPASPAKPASSSSSSIKTNLKMVKLSASDDPLSSSQGSQWGAYYKDNSIRDEIEKDVRRTYSSFHFFMERVRPLETTPEEIRKANAEEKSRLAKEQAAMNARAAARESSNERPNLFASSPPPSSLPNLFDESTLLASTVAKDTSAPLVTPRIECAPSAHSTRAKMDETHHDVIKRILFVYAKLNPGIRYVQGMNEILAPLYYVFAHNGSDLRRFVRNDAGESVPLADDVIEKDAHGLFSVEHAEADAFFCFTAIMSHMRDRFIKSLDLAPTGILNVIAHLTSLLQRVDHQLWAHLQTIGCDSRFFAFRWLTLILSQEFELPDVLRLWDSLFAAEPEASFESMDAAAAAASGGSRKTSSAAAASPASADDSTNKKLIVEFLNDVCCALLCLIRRPLLAADFGSALKALQSAGQGVDVQRLLFKAQEIQKIRRAGGGFVQAAAKTPAIPPPLSAREREANFTVPQPRPGEREAPKRPLQIALLDATKEIVAGKHTAAPTSAAGISLKSSPDAVSSSSASVSAGASAAASSLSSSVSSALHVAGSGVGALAGEVGVLLQAAGHAAASGLHVVEHAVEQAAQAAEAIVHAGASAAADVITPHTESDAAADQQPAADAPAAKEAEAGTEAAAGRA